MSTSVPQPLVSVLMPTYNRAQLLPRAIDSLLAQTFQDWELVIVDDGSNDATPAVLAEWLARDRRIRVVTHERNRGLADSLNTAVEAARGEFCTRLDDDDELFPTTLERFLEKFGELGPTYGMVVGNSVDPQTTVVTGLGFPAERELTYADAICQRFKGDFGGMWRSELLTDLRFDPRAYAGEDLVWHQVYRRTRAWYMPDLVKKYHRGESTTNAVTEVGFDDRAKWAARAEFERLYIEEFGADLRALCRETLAHHYQVRALYEVVARRRLDSLRSVLAAFCHRPNLRHTALLAMPFLPRVALNRLLNWSQRRYWTRLERATDSNA